jgi:hypothetical protein
MDIWNCYENTEYRKCQGMKTKKISGIGSSTGIHLGVAGPNPDLL